MTLALLSEASYQNEPDSRIHPTPTAALGVQKKEDKDAKSEHKSSFDGSSQMIYLTHDELALSPSRSRTNGSYSPTPAMYPISMVQAVSPQESRTVTGGMPSNPKIRPVFYMQQALPTAWAPAPSPLQQISEYSYQVDSRLMSGHLSPE